MALDMITLSLAKKYVDDVLENAGSLKGANCTIKSITETSDGNLVVFQYQNEDGTVETQEMTVKHGKDGEKGDIGDPGVSVTKVVVDSSNHLIITLSNGTTQDAGLVPTIAGKDGEDGKSGTDGVSPTVTTKQTDTGAIITITDVNGDHVASLSNGQDGKDGQDGQDGQDGKKGDTGAYVMAIALTKDETGLIVGGTATLSDNSSVEITVS